jgi:predicted flap endonuclease-1-like 5' DNA nuclease
MANMKIEEIEGIGPAYGEKLREAGINDTDGLLAAGKTKKGRGELAEKSGLSEKQILKWTNMADLFQISGVGPEMSELLEAAGVDTVPELAQRNAANLATKMAEVNEEKKLVRRVPSEADTTKWVAQAKELPRMIEY